MRWRTLCSRHVLVLLALQRGEDVAADELQHRLVLGRIHDAGLVALQHDGALDHAVAQHRHAHPVVAVGAEVAQWPGDLRLQLVGVAAQRLAVVQHVPGQRALAIAQAYIRRAGGGSSTSTKYRNRNSSLLGVEPHDEAVLGVHQRADDGVDALEQVGHVAVGAGQVGDREQRALHLLGVLEARHACRAVRRPRARCAGAGRPPAAASAASSSTCRARLRWSSSTSTTAPLRHSGIARRGRSPGASRGRSSVRTSRARARSAARSWRSDGRAGSLDGESAASSPHSTCTPRQPGRARITSAMATGDRARRRRFQQRRQPRQRRRGERGQGVGCGGIHRGTGYVLVGELQL